ncbi:hypothetical protein CXT87_02810 [Akkermansia muciniphila]|nr:hypothetical protein CXT87_02810 [Akkermansia muciniphila]PND03078.1 hypothetical protein CXT86_08780 [Akkermansia muciniphila]
MAISRKFFHKDRETGFIRLDGMRSPQGADQILVPCSSAIRENGKRTKNSMVWPEDGRLEAEV